MEDTKTSLDKKSVSQWLNQRRNYKIVHDTWKWKHSSKIFELQQELCLWQYRPNSNNTNPNKQLNFPPKIIRQRRTNKSQWEQKEGNDKDQRVNK